MAVAKELTDGEMFLANLEADKAKRKFAAAIKKDDKEPRAHFGMAEALLGIPNADPEKIVSAYQSAIDLETENPLYLTALGSFLVEMGRFDAAEKLYDQAATVDEDNAPAYYSDFAIGYWRMAPIVLQKLLDDQGERIIKRKALVYLIKALDLDAERAKDLLG